MAVPESVRVEKRADGVAALRIDRPPMNALSRALLDEIESAARHLDGDDEVKAVVVLGGAKAFAAGADISELGSQAEAREMGKRFRAAFDRIAEIPRPVIAAINGVALGGGLELALACDLRIAADNARVGQPEILLGIIPGAGATQRLPRLVGPAQAKELIWSGRQVKADEALAMGIVDRVVPAGALEEAALEWAASFASGAVVAMGVAKVVIDAGLDGSVANGLDLEAEAFVEVFGTEDAATGVRSFLEHGPGKAKFAGR
jgi:enoyl-CoA hydratase/carnithine racemase